MKLTKTIAAIVLFFGAHAVMAESYKAPEVKLAVPGKVKPKVQKESWEESSYKLEEDPTKARDVASEDENEEKQTRGPSSKLQPKPAPETERPRYWHLTK